MALASIVEARGVFDDGKLSDEVLFIFVTF